MDFEKDFPYSFDQKTCSTCSGNCCRGSSGYIWVSLEELEIIADSRNMNLSSFYGEYTRLVDGKVSLQERLIDGEHLCCFFDPGDCLCTIYENRPEQCRTFPFWNRFKDELQYILDECPGVTLK